MATKTKGFDKLGANLAKAINGALAGNKRLEAEILTDVQKTLRSGRLLTGKKITSLEDSTKKRRRDLSRVNKTHPDFKPDKSNLTFSGQFIDSFRVRFSRVRNTVIYRLSPSGVNRGVTNLNGTRARGVSNTTIGEGLIASGRDYREVNSRFAAKIKKLVIRELRRTLRL